MSIGGSILNLELSRPHDTFMAQIKAAWQMVRSNDEEEPDAKDNLAVERSEVSDGE